jgi:hypothetical protein
VVTRLPRYATDALLITLGLLLTVAVAVDVARSNALAQRMHRDRSALLAYLHPHVVDPHLVSISVRGSRDLVCVPRHGRHRTRVCIHVVHTDDGAHGPAPAAKLGPPSPAPER